MSWERTGNVLETPLESLTPWERLWNAGTLGNVWGTLCETPWECLQKITYEHTLGTPLERVVNAFEIWFDPLSFLDHMFKRLCFLDSLFVEICIFGSPCIAFSLIGWIHWMDSVDGFSGWIQ